ncbi:MotA/TolQ/ExbB proton channel family protein [Campylobacter lari]|uniref:MotA/TolQ/ExbB proton channel family protein n=1 Tax=Campylobacter lari TaxID=201 RepID=UPI0021F6BFC1|nr:MotA/TolQ/ExbB proton channel family protein [Campylobacter lari]MCW0185297.1 MotA/TolQ/ExbB proton channel family protein [Campylobacter lari]
MEVKTTDDFSDLVLPEGKGSTGIVAYLKIIFIPAILYILVLLGYFGKIDFKVELHSVAMIGIIFLVALIFARHSADYASSIFEQQKDEFKLILKRYIMKHFLVIGKETKSNASFDDFAYAYVKDLRNENFASVGAAIFPMLGILGTFISIAMSMPNFNSSDTAGLEQEISVLLNGVGTAFYVSIYGIFLALWWIFFEKYGSSKFQKLLNRQKNATSDFFWSKEEIDRKYLQESLQHFEKIGTIFEHVSNEEFFKELDNTIDRKFKVFQELVNAEEKAVRLSSEHVKQTMSDLSKTQREQKDIVKTYSEIANAVNMLNSNIKDLTLRISEQYNRLLDVSSDKIMHLDKSVSALDEKVNNFSNNIEKYQNLMLDNQTKLFEGFRASIIEGMHTFKEAYEDEKNIDEKISLMQEFKEESKELDEQTTQVIAKLENQKEDEKIDDKK